MSEIRIRKFNPSDVEAYIRLSKTSFAEEWTASGITLDDFETQTRQIFRWKMIPYKLLTALMGIKWEAFVAEADGKIVGGGMYIGRKDHMTITNLMVDPNYRRQGIGQSLLVKRLERLTELGVPFVTVQVLETNQASLGNLIKQGFEIYNKFTVYEHPLPMPVTKNLPAVTVREIRKSDKAVFAELEKQTTQQVVLRLNGGVESQYFVSPGQKLYSRFIGYQKWLRAFEVEGKTIGFLGAEFQKSQYKGYLLSPMVGEEDLKYFPGMIRAAKSWLESAGKVSMILEVPDHRTAIHNDLLSQGWEKQRTWIELVKWL